jgi:beta-glucanase (GH16 family)
MRFTLILLFYFFHLASFGQGTLIWSDEFNGPDLDLNKWTFDIGQGSWGWGNNELQYYTNSSSNVSVDNGYLSITALNEQFGSANYTSSRIKSKDLFEFQYGMVEARIKVPLGQGLWPAFWMLGANIDDVSWPQCGEIDILEHINNETVIHGTHHYNNNGWQYSGGSASCDPSVFQVYSIEWSPLSIKWFLNGVMYYETDISSSSVSKEEFHEPFFFLINLAVGGNWPGSPNGATQFPAVMQVDYVRVYQGDYGCTDPSADNYDSNAAIDDGSCTYGSSLVNITLSVNTANITVGPNGMYAGGGVLGDALAVPLSDPNGTGTWTGVVTVNAGTTGNYIFLNSPANGGDWGTKEDLSGQSCADINNWNDRILPNNITSDITLLHCFGSCETDGSCSDVVTSGCTDATANNYNASATTDDGSCMYNVTLTVDMNCSGLTPGAVAATGPSDGWSCGTYALSDGDGDGVWEGTFSFASGTFEYIYCTDGWAQQETPGLLFEMQNGGSCAPITDYANWANRLITVGAITTSDSWGSCSSCAGVTGCPEDVDNDGFVTVNDVLSVLSEFGCTEGCLYDINLDGIVGVSDILDILAAFGDEC